MEPPYPITRNLSPLELKFHIQVVIGVLGSVVTRRENMDTPCY